MTQTNPVIINSWETTGVKLPKHRRHFDDEVTMALNVVHPPTVVEFDTLLSRRPAPARERWYRRKVVPVRALLALTTVSVVVTVLVIR